MKPLALLVVAILAWPASAAPATLSVAAVQYPIEGDAKAADIARKVEGYVVEAKKGGAELVVFPELLTLDAWPMGDKRGDEAIGRSIAADITPGYFKLVKALATKHKIAIIGGSSPRIEGGKIYNTAIIAFADGKVVMQDKINLTYWETDNGWTGGDELRPFDAPWGRSIVLICYDVEFPTVSAALIEERPLVWFVPSMTDSVHGLERVRWSSQARAVEHHAYVVVTGTVGTPSKDFPNVGQAAFITPRRAPFPIAVREGERDKAGVVFGRLDLKALRESRVSAKLYPAKDARSPPRVKRVER